MPVARYFLWVGSVLLALLFIADARLPNLTIERRDDALKPVIRISSERKWPERIVFDTSAPMPHVVAAARQAALDPTRQAAVIIPHGVREARAQLQASDVIQMHAAMPKKQSASAPRQHKITKRHVARPPLGIARQSQYAWFGGRMWW